MTTSDTGRQRSGPYPALPCSGVPSGPVCHPSHLPVTQHNADTTASDTGVGSRTSQSACETPQHRHNHLRHRDLVHTQPYLVVAFLQSQLVTSEGHLPVSCSSSLDLTLVLLEALVQLRQLHLLAVQQSCTAFGHLFRAQGLFLNKKEIKNRTECVFWNVKSCIHFIKPNWTRTQHIPTSVSLWCSHIGWLGTKHQVTYFPPVWILTKWRTEVRNQDTISILGGQIIVCLLLLSPFHSQMQRKRRRIGRRRYWRRRRKRRKRRRWRHRGSRDVGGGRRRWLYNWCIISYKEIKPSNEPSKQPAPPDDDVSGLNAVCHNQRGVCSVLRPPSYGAWPDRQPPGHAAPASQHNKAVNKLMCRKSAYSSYSWDNNTDHGDFFSTSATLQKYR